MIRRLLARLLPGTLKAKAPRIYRPGDHPVRRVQLSRGALEVTRKLQDAGFKAFVVGGAVRDLLLGIEPCSFDRFSGRFAAYALCCGWNDRIHADRFDGLCTCGRRPDTAA
jgi:hypothetical protein